MSEPESEQPAEESAILDTIPDLPSVPTPDENGIKPLNLAREFNNQQAYLKTRSPKASTGFLDLDTATGGLQSGDLFVVAAASGMGKTALCLNIAHHIAITRCYILF